MMLKKTGSMIGIIVLTFCFGLGIAGLTPTIVKADMPPQAICDYFSLCEEVYASDCPPGEFRTISYEGRDNRGCCGEASAPSGCNPPR